MSEKNPLKTPLLLSKDGSEGFTPTRKPTFIENLLQDFQLWCILHPRNVISRLLLRLIALLEGVAANFPEYLPSKRDAYGPNFCVAGEVVMGEFETVAKHLTSPQARTYRLGTSVLDSSHLPSMDKKNGRNLFLLAQSDKGAGGSGEHEAFRQAINVYVIRSPGAMQRSNDVTAKALLARLATDYAEMTTGKGGTFFTDTSRGLSTYFVRYLHYVLFGLDPYDEEKIELLTDLFYDSKVTLFWFRVFGNLFGLSKKKDLKWRANVKKVATIYENSPALAKFEEGNPIYKNLTRKELAEACLPLMGIAGMVGPKHLAEVAMGCNSLPSYVGHEGVAKIDPTKWWDMIDLNDRNALKRYLFECGRLWTPVNASHCVATEEFTVNIRGKNRTFQKGTIILIPMVLGMLDEGTWGPTTYGFDHNRKNLCPYSMIFHSVGDNHAGRICPGREFTVNMMVSILQVTGKVRRDLHV